MGELKLYLFGVPRLERDGDNLPTSRRKGLALLAYVSLQGQPQSREALATLLWPDFDQSRALSNLRRELSRLKSDVQADLLEADRLQVALAPGSELWVDVNEFRRHLALVAGHDHHFPAEPCVKCQVALTEAVALCRERFMAGFNLPQALAFDDWQFFEAESLSRACGDSLQRLLQWHAGAGNHEKAIAYGRRWLTLDTLHEPAHRELMALYAQAGQQAAALRQYEECLRLLDEELGIAPETETTALYEAIRMRRFPEGERGPSAPTPATARTLLPAERYVLEEQIAGGGQGEVFLGRDAVTGGPVIVKRLRSELVTEGTRVARFLRESKALAQLDHPNIVRMLDTFEQERQHCIVMEYVPGGTLADRLREEGPLPLDEVLALALELADALGRAHHLGIIHRDLKPGNVLLTVEGAPRLADFGTAWLENAEVRLTQTGMLIGSPAYLSPEALRNETLNARSDIWSFGVLLYELLAGRRPFEAEGLTQIVVAVLTQPLPPLASFREDLPPALVALIEQMLAKDPAGRPVSIRQVAAALETIRGGGVPPGLGPAPAAPPIPAAAQTSPAFAVPFVGREQELAWLEEALDAAMAGQGCVCFVVGEAGQGKTTLLQTFVQRAQAHYPQLVAATGNCNAYTGQGDPYLPFREILQLLTGHVAHDAAGGAPGTYIRRLLAVVPRTLEALVDEGPHLLESFLPSRPLLQRAAALAPGGAPWLASLQALVQAAVAAPDTNPLLRQSALFAEYAAVLEAVARHRPLLLLVDDLQWSDKGSATLLLHLGKRLASQNILLVGAYRPAEVAVGRRGERHPLQQVVHELQRDFGPIVLDLEESEGRAFVDALLDAEPHRLDEAFRATLYAQTQGHPLFTVELLRGMQERGDLHRATDGAWIASYALDWDTLPARVEGAIGERIDRLDPRLRELLQLASVVGETFPLELLARLEGSDPRELARLLGEELDRGHRLVQAMGVRREGERRIARHRFRHILFQRYLYQNMDDVERAYRHEAVAEALEALYGEDAPTMAAELARHFAAAQLPARAAPYYRYAGDQARRAGALVQAMHHYRRALSAWPDDDAAGRALLLRRLGECTWISGQLETALAHFQAAYDLYLGQDDSTGAGAMQRAIGRLHWEQGDRQRALHHYEQALALLERGPETVDLAWAYSSISQMHMLAWEHDAAVAWGERALALARRLDAPDVLSHALNNAGISSLWLGETEQALASLRESKALALEHHLPHDAGRAFYNLGSALQTLDRYDEAWTEFDGMLQHAQRWRVPLYAGSALAELAGVEWITGRWRAALARQPGIQDWLQRSESLTYLEILNNLVRANMANTLGQPEEALSYLAESAAAVENAGEGQMWMPYLKEQIRALAMLDRHEEVGAAVMKMLALAAPGFIMHSDSVLPLLAACRWAAEKGRWQEAGALLEKIEAIAECLASRSTGAVLQECQGMIAFHQKMPDDAAVYLGAAAESLRELGRPYDEARARAALAGALAALGRQSEAQAARIRAADLLDSLADQLDDESSLASFRASPLVRAAKQAGKGCSGAGQLRVPCERRRAD